jgi:hypothetical protein
MTLHLLKHPVNPVALQILGSASSNPSASSTVIFLSSTGTIPQLPGAKVYRVTDSSSTDGNAIPYSQVVDLIFAADKVIAW